MCPHFIQTVACRVRILGDLGAGGQGGFEDERVQAVRARDGMLLCPAAVGLARTAGVESIIF